MLLVQRMIGGTFRQSFGPLFAPYTQQLVSLKHFRPVFHPSRLIARAATTAQPAQRKKQELESRRPADFRSLGLSPELLVATQENGLAEPTEIQVSIESVGLPSSPHPLYSVLCPNLQAGLVLHRQPAYQE